MSPFRMLDVGLAVHQASIAVADVAQEHGAKGIARGTIGTRQANIDQLTRTLPAQANHLVFVDEAGPCGFWGSRDLRQKGDDCWSVAPPSLMPKKAGDRVNTDRREAMGQAAALRGPHPCRCPQR